MKGVSLKELIESSLSAERLGPSLRSGDETFEVVAGPYAMIIDPFLIKRNDDGNFAAAHKPGYP